MRAVTSLAAAVLLWLVQGGAACGQLAIDVPTKVELGQPIVAAVQLPEGGKVAWKSQPGAAVIDAGGGKCYVWAKPGKHRIEAVVVAVKDGQLGSLDWLEATFEVSGGVTPPPTPPPPVPSGKRIVYVVYESAKLTPQLSTMLSDLMVGDSHKALAAKGHRAQTRDFDSIPDAMRAKVANVFRGEPVAFVLDAANNNVLLHAPLPADGAGIMALVAQAGG